MQGWVLRTFKNVTVQTGETTTTNADVSDYVEFNIPSNPGATQPYAGPASGYPRGQPRRVVDGDGVETVFDYSTTHGRLKQVAVGGINGVVTDYSFDLWGRLQSVTANSTSNQPSVWNVTQDVRHRTLVAA